MAEKFKLKLSDPGRSFHDPATNLYLHGDNVEEVEHVGALTKIWIREGGIVDLNQVRATSDANVKVETSTQETPETPGGDSEGGDEEETGSTPDESGDSEEDTKGEGEEGEEDEEEEDTDDSGPSLNDLLSPKPKKDKKDKTTKK